MWRIGLALALGCGGGSGGGDVPLDCGDVGSGDVDGTAQGIAMSPAQRAFLLPPSGDTNDLFVLVLDNTPGPACTSASDPHGDHLLLILCDARPPTGDFSQTTPCPLQATGFLERSTGEDVALATTTTATIDRSDTCFSGSFETDFGGETMTGTFAAVVCP